MVNQVQSTQAEIREHINQTAKMVGLTFEKQKLHKGTLYYQFKIDHSNIVVLEQLTLTQAYDHVLNGYIKTLTDAQPNKNFRFFGLSIKELGCIYQ